MREEAAAVLRIFVMFLCGMSILKITAAPVAEGIKSPVGKSDWSKRTIDMILSSKKQCGYSIVKAGDKSYECVYHHEPMISLDLFERVQKPKQKVPIPR